jgi:deazaflavin-dependent oxidoreductase (nitroreductase family)
MALFGQEHIDRYVATDGEEGHDWQGTQTLILTTTGRRSGQQRVHPLIYGRHGDDYLVVASKGGAPQHPDWYLNLAAHPEVERFRSRVTGFAPMRARRGRRRRPSCGRS